jgi:class 3 adenylate cyclase
MIEDVGRGGWSLQAEDDMSGGGVVGAFALPTGTVTFLLSDLQWTSPRRKKEVHAGAVASMVVRRHHDLLDDVISRHSGVRPGECDTRQGEIGAFSRASDALAAALEAQRVFTADVGSENPGVSLRMAVHTGEAQLREEGSYFGQLLVRCARVLALGHGGQVLVSAAAAAVRPTACRTARRWSIWAFTG